MKGPGVSWNIGKFWKRHFQKLKGSCRPQPCLFSLSLSLLVPSSFPFSFFFLPSSHSLPSPFHFHFLLSLPLFLLQHPLYLDKWGWFPTCLYSVCRSWLQKSSSFFLYFWSTTTSMWLRSGVSLMWSYMAGQGNCPCGGAGKWEGKMGGSRQVWWADTEYGVQGWRLEAHTYFTLGLFLGDQAEKLSLSDSGFNLEKMYLFESDYNLRFFSHRLICWNI